MEPVPFNAFASEDVHAGAWLANFIKLYKNDTKRVKAALSKLGAEPKKVLDEIAHAIEGEYLATWVWTWDALQRAMLYIEKEEERKKNEKTFFEAVIHFPEDHPDVIRAVSYTATAVTVGGAVVPALGATGLATMGVVKAVTTIGAKIGGVATGTVTTIAKKSGMVAVSKGMVKGVGELGKVTGLKPKKMKKAVTQSEELPAAAAIEITTNYGKDKALLKLLCEVGTEDFRRLMIKAA